jgi:aromatic-amino-acid transaminase
MFRHIEPYPGDPILTLNESYFADPRSNKVNLSIGVYLNAAGKMPVMRAALKAEQAMFEHLGTRPYLPMEGDAGFRRTACELIFGAGHVALQEERIASVQTLGGSGALKVGADFLKRYFPQAGIWVSDPTWDNHHGIFAGAGLPVGLYPYYDAASGGVDFAAMLDCLKRLPAGDIVLLHACCHNPTGADLSAAQWRALAVLMRERGLLAFFDMAYQGFGAGVDADAFAIRHFAEQGIALLVASSFSKNFSLYGERCGALNIVCADARQAATVLGQLKAGIRRIYSSPPTHGARIVAAVLGSDELQAEWRAELETMRLRVAAMRQGLHEVLWQRCPQADIDYLKLQTGMFSFTGLSVQQVRRLREEHAVYLVDSGRICPAALTEENITVTADAMAQVMR